jgi:hypothetical protein
MTSQTSIFEDIFLMISNASQIRILELFISMTISIIVYESLEMKKK